MHASLHTFTDRKRTKCSKGSYLGENRIKGKFMSKCMFNCYLNLRCSVTDVTANGKRFQFVTTLYAKLFRLLWVLPVWWSSLIDDLLSPGLLENLNNWIASKSIWLLSILWVRTKSFLSLLFPRGCNFRDWSRSSYVRPLRPFTHRVAALWILSRWLMSFLRYGQLACMAFSRGMTHIDTLFKHRPFRNKGTRPNRDAFEQRCCRYINNVRL